jgi:hypothetical protein
MPDALELLKTRRSIKPVELAGPAPSAAEIETLVTIASRAPDHGKLVPWRFIIFEGQRETRPGTPLPRPFAPNTRRPNPSTLRPNAAVWRARRS